MTDFATALSRGLVLLDAAIGTRLVAAGLRLDADDPCLWNLTHPEAVLALHHADVAAGSEAVLTNTFGANRSWLARFGREWAEPERVEAINRAAVELARRAAGPGRLVVGALGPTAADGGLVAEQARTLLDAGADGLLFETHRLDQAEEAIGQLRELGPDRPRVPILVSLVAWPEDPGEAVARLTESGVAAIGGNCQVGMAAGLELAGRLRAATPLPLIIKPAAGLPGGPLDDPESFARHVPRLRALAPVLVGGCCGTNAAHVAALRSACYPGAGEGESVGK